MEIDLDRFGADGLSVKPHGRLDLDNAVEFGTTVKDTVEDEDIKNLVLDFEDVTFMSSFGLKVILELHKSMTEIGTMKLVHVSEVLMKSFKMVGFDKFLVIE